MKRGAGASKAATISYPWGTVSEALTTPSCTCQQWAPHGSPGCQAKKVLFSEVGEPAAHPLSPYYASLVVSGPPKSYSALHSVILNSSELPRDGEEKTTFYQVFVDKNFLKPSAFFFFHSSPRPEGKGGPSVTSNSLSTASWPHQHLPRGLNDFKQSTL